jgi:molybdopterin-guanine dinucleotide biosynthesis protein A
MERHLYEVPKNVPIWVGGHWQCVHAYYDTKSLNDTLEWTVG